MSNEIRSDEEFVLSFSPQQLAYFQFREASFRDRTQSLLRALGAGVSQASAIHGDFVYSTLAAETDPEAG